MEQHGQKWRVPKLNRTRSSPSAIRTKVMDDRMSETSRVDRAPSAMTSQRRFPIQRPLLQRNFGVTDRKPIQDQVGRAFHELGPGQYDTHTVGGLNWDPEREVSHPGQKQLSNHKSPALTTFGKPKSQPLPHGPPLLRSPGPGHYELPDCWDRNWQSYPTMGKSFVRHIPPRSGGPRFGDPAGNLATGAQANADAMNESFAYK